jgi:hypothetical protein
MAMTNESQRIDELQREVERLRGELARYKPQPVIARPDGPFVLPDIERVEKLVARVFEKYPNLRADVDRDIALEDYTIMVHGALRYIGTLQRMKGAVHRQRDYLDWCYVTDDFLNGIGKSGTTRGSSFFTACIAAGDVCYTPPSMWPTTHDVGLIIGHRTNCSAPTNAWLRVAAGDFNEALVIPPPAPLHAPRQPHEVVKDWRGELSRGQ